MNTAGAIAFCTVGSVIAVIAAIQCYRIWQQDKKLKKARLKDAPSDERDNTTNTTADLKSDGEHRGGGLTIPGDTPNTTQLGKSLELYPPPAWTGGSGTRPNSGYDGLEVVSSTPDMVQRKDFAIPVSTSQAQQRPGGSSWTGSWTEYANSITNFGNGQVRNVVSEQKLHQTPALQHQNQGLLQPSSMALPSRSPSPISAVQGAAQFVQGESMNHHSQRNENSTSIYSMPSTVELATPSPLAYRPYTPRIGQEMYSRTPSKSPEAVGGRTNIREKDSSIQELENPMQRVSNCSTASQIDAQPPDRPFSGARAHNRHMSTESHKYRAYHPSVDEGKVPNLLPRPAAPLHSHSTSLPVTGEQQVTISKRTASEQVRSVHQKPGRFSLNALTTALPKGKR
ncbi:hypothetical protein LTR84_002630 [Exophiala bonariae]|uniref:Uncharacterized protein n=1 Tax=Exophiala bonariae TaxID=1690606 RepID=A0AAV9NAA3_9EURO|nr:hypothetical protein LTR84_002630 [Exophiala bonariae]